MKDVEKSVKVTAESIKLQDTSLNNFLGTLNENGTDKRTKSNAFSDAFFGR
jgi:hypothetical protein